MIGPFIRRRHGREPVAVPHPAMEPILRRTYGVIVYQEQVIEVAAAVAGFSLAEADMLRRAMTHERSMEEMDEIGRTFVEKAVARGVEQAAAEEVFRQLRGFAAYGFNKAHAACFAIVCNASAWLKAHYPAEFYAGILNNQPMGFYSPRVVLNDARRFGLEVLPLDVNLSGEWFEVEDDGAALRVGLAYVKEMSAAARRAIVEGRGDGRDKTAPEWMGASGGAPLPPGRASPALQSPLRPPPTPPPFPARPAARLANRPAQRLVARAGRARLRPARPAPTSPSPTSWRARASAARSPRTSCALGAFDALGVRREELVAQVPLLYAGARPRDGRARCGKVRRNIIITRARRRPRPAAPRPRRADRAARPSCRRGRCSSASPPSSSCSAST